MNFFGIKLYMFRAARLFINQEFFTLNTAMVYVILKFQQPGKITSIQIYMYTSNWEISPSNWFYYKYLSRCTVTWTSKRKNTAVKVHVFSHKVKRDWSLYTCLTQLCGGIDMYNLLHKEQLHVSALYIGHLQVDKWETLVSSYTRLVWVVYRGEDRGGVGTRSRMCCVGRVVWVHGGSAVFYSRLIYGIILC